MAGVLQNDNSDVKTAQELLKSHANEQVKQHILLDTQGRPQFTFTTYVGAVEGDPCMADEYIYKDATSTVVIGRQERVYKWKAAWDTNFTFDPTVSYDPDGDGLP
jgi:hypothetical protein